MMKKFTRYTSSAMLLMAMCMAVPAAEASVADDFEIPSADRNARVGASMPYVRYDSQSARLDGGATLKATTTMNRNDVASQASNQSYIDLPGNGASAEWTMNSTGRGVTMRFTMPDSGDGKGLKGSLDVYVNNRKVKTVDLNSYWMWQYFTGGNPQDTPGGIGCFAFDEVHFLLSTSLKQGDRIKIQSSGANNLAYGVDFLEIEEVPDPIEMPDNAVSVTDYGATPDDGGDDLSAFVRAVEAADRGGKVVYIPEGTWHLGGMWNIYCSDVKITGAGMWYSNIQFTSDKAFGGGISGGNGSNGGADDYCRNLEFCHVYINSNLSSRYNQQAVYKCFMDIFTSGSVIHDVWQDHFECGFWFGDYNGAMGYSDGVKVVNCRIRNNLADGVNFCQGTSNATVYNCSIRNNGDDGLACWNNSYMNAKDETGNVFAYNTIEFIWRAGGIAIYGGDNFKIYNNYLRDMFMAAGIHLNSTFDGYKYSNTRNIVFDNNILVHCGTNADSWGEDLAAVDIKQDVRNVTFNNTQIYDSPFYSIRLLNGPTGVTFNDTKILGTGLTGESINYSCVEHTAGAIRCQTNEVKFSGLEIGGYLHDKKGNNSTFPLWTDNNRQMADAIGATLLGSDIDYTVPDYPAPDNTPQGGGVTNPLEGISGYDVALTGLAWKNRRGETTLKEGDQVTFTAAITNQSAVDIPPKAKIVLQVEIDDASTLTVTYRDGLKAGESVKLSPSAMWKATLGGHEAVATVDPQNVLDKEANEENNNRTKRFNVEKSSEIAFTPVTGGYDLSIAKITANDNNPIEAGGHVVFTAIVVNAGDVDIPAGRKIGVQFQVDGVDYSKGHITWCDTYSGGLKARESVTLTCNGGGGASGGSENYWTATDGDHTVMGWVDDTDIWSNEVDENNNKTSVALKIPFGGISYIEHPDQPDNLDGNEQVQVTENGIRYTIAHGVATAVGYTDDMPSMVTIPSTVQGCDVVAIASRAFENCDKIESLSFAFDSRLQTIGDHAFKNASIRYLHFPWSALAIEPYAFEGIKITHLNIPANVTSIGEGAFFGNAELETASIATEMEQLPKYVFSASPRLNKLYLACQAVPGRDLDNSFFDNESLSIYVRPGLVDEYSQKEYPHVQSDIPLTLNNDVEAFSCGFDMDFSESEGLVAHKGSYDASRNVLSLDAVSKVPAYNGVVLIGEAGKTYKARMCESVTDDFDGNRIYAAVDATYLEKGNNSMLQSDGQFHSLAEDGFTPYWSAYLPMSATSPISLQRPSSSGVQEVEMIHDSDIDEYFNLQGVKVDGRNLQRGIYIHRHGIKVSKIVVE